jgi:hypothetical protein
MTIRSLFDIGDLQKRQFSTPKPGRIKGHQNDAVERSRSGLNELRHLLLTENLRQPEVPFRVRRVGNAPGFLQDGNEEEPQRARPLIHGIRRQLAVAEQIRLILANVRWLELVRRFFKLSGQIFDCPDVRAFGSL